MRSVFLALMSLLIFANPKPLLASDHTNSVSVYNKVQPVQSETATHNLMKLNQSIFGIYEHAIKIFEKDLFSKHPVIIAQLSGSGARMVLYRPDFPPEEASPIPFVYQVMKALSHSTLAVTEIVLPYVDRSDDQSWIPSMRTYLAETKMARERIDLVDMPDKSRANARAIRDINIQFMEGCLVRGHISKKDIDNF